jgi:hypothetical protein
VKFSDVYSELIKRGFDEKNDGKFKLPKPKSTGEQKKKGSKKAKTSAGPPPVEEIEQVSGWIAVDIIGENYRNKINQRKNSKDPK